MAAGALSVAVPYTARPRFRISFAPAASPLRTRLPSPFATGTEFGQMQPLPMNEFIQENLRDVGVEVTLDVMEWEAPRGRRRAGADAPENAGADGLNNSWGYVEPINGLIGYRLVEIPPAGGDTIGERSPTPQQTTVVGAAALRKEALNWTPCVRSLIQNPLA